MAQQNPKVIEVLTKLQQVETQVIETGYTSEGEVGLDKLRKEFMEVFKEEKKASLIGVLNYLAGSFPQDTVKVPPPRREYISRTDEMKMRMAHLMRSRVADLIEMSLKEVTVEELPELWKFVEEQAVPPDGEFNISDTIQIKRLISCMQMAVPFYKRDARGIKLLELVNTHKILDHFDKLPEEREVDFLKALADISPFTRLHVSEKMLPSIVELFKKYMPDEVKKFEGKNSSTHLECVLYVFHRLAHEVGAAHATTEVPKLSPESLETVMTITWARIRDLRKTLSEDNQDFLDAKERMKGLKDKLTMRYKFITEKRMLNTITELRTCINILAMTEVLLAKKTCFIGDESINLSWKEPRKPLVSDIKKDKYPVVQNRPNEMTSLPYDCRQCLEDLYCCDLSESEARSLVSLRKEQLRNHGGKFLLHDDTNVAALFWKIPEGDLREFVKGVSWNKFSGKIRDQLYHLLCWAYVASDLVSSSMFMLNREVDNVALCTWYLCAFTNPKALGTDIRTDPQHLGKDIRPQDRHHCYGATIENALSHIQAHGIPREIIPVFDCKKHQPPTSDEAWLKLRKIKSVKRISSFKEAMQELRNRPIGADLLQYSGLFEVGKRIYYGPHRHQSEFQGYHGVFIEGVDEMEGELVAVCKLSNGLEIGHDGYVYVSLATQYFPVGASDKKRRFVRGLHEPSHLLSNFVSLELEVGEEEEKARKNEKRKRPEKEEEVRRNPRRNTRDVVQQRYRPSRR